MKSRVIGLLLAVVLLVGICTANYTSQYPPSYSSTYVKATTTYTTFYPYLATDPSQPLTGTWDANAWSAGLNQKTNQRFHIDLGSSKTIKQVYYENAHTTGANSNWGVKNYTLWGSNDDSAFLNLTYTNDTGWTQLTTNTTAFLQHVAANTVDPQYISVTNDVAYRYYAFKISDNYLGTQQVVRRIELQSEDAAPPSPDTWYQFGDSITYPSYTFVMQMNETYNSSVISDHNIDGSGETSIWGVSKYASHPGTYVPTKYFIMLGINDRYYNATDTGTMTADNLYTIYNWTRANGSTPYIVLEPARTSVGTLADQRDNMTLIQTRLNEYNVSYIKAYDAIDLHPLNNVFDDINTTTQPDNVHPSEAAHALIADYVWERLVPGTASFNQSVTTGASPLMVTFTDTTNRSPTMWTWNATNVVGNNTPFTFSTEQNPLAIFDTGSFMITLNATNPGGNNISTQISWVNTSPDIIAGFSSVPNPSSVGSSVQFYDGSSGSPTTWNWTFGDIGGANTSTLQDPTHTYMANGSYTVNLTVTNITGDQSTLLAFHNVTDVSGLVHQDVFMEAQKTLTLNFKSSTNGEMIPVVQVYNQVDATTVNTTNGTFIGTYSFGTQAFIFHSEGYVSRTGSYFVDDNVEYTVQMVPVAPSSNPNTNIIYSPKLVRFRAVDKWRNPLTPVNITASYIADTLPNNDPTYLQNAFGVSASVVSLMMNSSIAMSGVTGVDGSNTFSMFPALTYNITITNATMGVSCQQNLAPADTDYVLYCPTSAQIAGTTPLSQTLNRSYIWVTEPNASWVTINSSYQDPMGLTSNVLFNVSVVDNNTVIYSHDFGNPGTSQVLDNYTMPNIRGMQITSYLAYNRSTS